MTEAGEGHPTLSPAELVRDLEQLAVSAGLKLDGAA